MTNGFYSFYFLKIILIFSGCLLVSSYELSGPIKNIKSNTSARDQEKATANVIRRYLPLDVQNNFRIRVDFKLNENTFKVCYK